MPVISRGVMAWQMQAIGIVVLMIRSVYQKVIARHVAFSPAFFIRKTSPAFFIRKTPTQIAGFDENHGREWQRLVTSSLHADR